MSHLTETSFSVNMSPHPPPPTPVSGDHYSASMGPIVSESTDKGEQEVFVFLGSDQYFSKVFFHAKQRKIENKYNSRSGHRKRALVETLAEIQFSKPVPERMMCLLPCFDKDTMLT